MTARSLELFLGEAKIVLCVQLLSPDAAAWRLRATEEQQQKPQELEQLRDNEERVRCFVVALLREQPPPRMLPFPGLSQLLQQQQQASAALLQLRPGLREVLGSAIEFFVGTETDCGTYMTSEAQRGRSSTSKQNLQQQHEEQRHQCEKTKGQQQQQQYQGEEQEEQQQQRGEQHHGEKTEAQQQQQQEGQQHRGAGQDDKQQQDQGDKREACQQEQGEQRQGENGEAQVQGQKEQEEEEEQVQQQEPGERHLFAVLKSPLPQEVSPSTTRCSYLLQLILLLILLFSCKTALAAALPTHTC
ncbi:hypothetical protein ACSSS7_007193 [Eimeria intestinalis]